MKIRYKTIEHERTEDAPFVGALISAIDCKFNCKGCFNTELKKEKTKTESAEKIIAQVKMNPFNKGIILGGLEWSEQPLEMMELCKVASENGLEVMIYTGCGLAEFQQRVGVACADKVGHTDLLNKNINTEQDKMIYTFLGTIILDTMIPSTHYIKTGLYDASDKSIDREHFGVRLASNNQNIYKFEQA